MKPHEVKFFKGRSGSIFATHPGLQGVYNAQTGNVYPELPVTAVVVSVIEALADLTHEGNTQ
jgi:hypothetical protein|tara:strand:+ start:2593 stop:2778 length:186 start_codon:yes stop_codon:yes gene_type:complete